MMRTCAFIAVAFFISGLTANAQKFSVKNNLDIERKETIAIPFASLHPTIKKDPAKIVVKDLMAQKTVVSQLIDANEDGAMDEIVFQTMLLAKQEAKFSIEMSKENLSGQSPNTTYARLVPERIDDFAWENDLVAFRTYGPEAQRLVDDGEKGGTLSSGIDCWLKRVNYPIIDKWYKKYIDGGSYHKDDGEGYDPYHVGISRGCGGIGVWLNDSLYISKNFISAKIIASGPVRTTFELRYAAWKANGVSIEEKKRISIDAGSQLQHIQVWLSATEQLPNCTVGVTLHDKKGVARINSSNGWMSYWEQIDDSMLGTGVVVPPTFATDFKDFRTHKKDLSHLYAVTKPKEGYVEYYAGFGWKKAGRFNSSEAWDLYLHNKSLTLASPLEIKVLKDK